MNFNLCHVRPHGFLHSSAFNEVIDSVAWALAAANHTVRISLNQVNDDERNIIFGPELLGASTMLPPGTILYNLEQPTHPNFPFIQKLARGHTVWDYSRRNLKVWQEAGIDCRHVPIGYTPNLTRIHPTEVKDIDCLFYGWMTPRRTRIVNELKDSGLRVSATDFAYGGSRDNLISRSRIVLNLHHDGRDMFEAVRVSYLMANGKCVLTEHSVDDDEYTDLAPELNFFDSGESKYAETVASLVESVSTGIDRRGYIINAIRRRDFVATVSKALSVTSDPHTRVHEVLRSSEQSGDMQPFTKWLTEHARGNILEIGVRQGASTAAFLAGLEQHGGHLYSIDIMDCGDLFKGHPQWTFKQISSQKYAAGYAGEPFFDLILIDGDHTREGYIHDLNFAWKVLKPGGIILSHDIVTQPGKTREEHPRSLYPSREIRTEYFRFCQERMLRHEELDGPCGMGVIYKPAQPRSRFDSDESWQASEAILNAR